VPVPKITGLMYNSYAWRLEVAVWTTTRRPDDDLRCRPRLMLVHRGWNDEEPEAYGVIGFIEYGQPGELLETGVAWLVYHYPKNAEGLWEHQDETRHRFRTLFNAGEARSPRPTAAAAMAFLLELAEDEIPRAEHSALRTTGRDFIGPLQKLTEAHGRRHPQPRRR
jgi:hypothetical protein